MTTSRTVGAPAYRTLSAALRGAVRQSQDWGLDRIAICRGTLALRGFYLVRAVDLQPNERAIAIVEAPSLDGRDG